jgi:hypothetical protein
MHTIADLQRNQPILRHNQQITKQKQKYWDQNKDQF